MAKLKSTSKARSGSARTSTRSAGSRPASAEPLSRSIMESAQQIWLAGMGAFNRAQKEGTKLFEALVSEGSSIEQKTRQFAAGGVDAMRGAVETKVDEVKTRATDTWDRLEKVFEDRVQHALTRLGVPGREDLQALIARVDQLNAELRKLSAKPAKAGPTAAPAKPKRAAVKKATPRKPVSPKAAVRSKPAAATRPAVSRAPVKHTEAGSSTE